MMIAENSLDHSRLKISTIESKHCLRRFDCGERQINDYARSKAYKKHANGTRRVFCAKSPGDVSAKGFYLLSLRREEDAKLKKGPELDAWRGSAHIVYINFLGVQRAIQGYGVGTRLLLDAITKAHSVSKILPIWGVGITPLSDRNKSYYEKMGFVVHDSETELAQPTMILPMLSVNELFDRNPNA